MPVFNYAPEISADEAIVTGARPVTAAEIERHVTGNDPAAQIDRAELEASGVPVAAIERIYHCQRFLPTRKQAAARRAIDAYAATKLDVIAYVVEKAAGRYEGFWYDMETALVRWGGLSERQEAAVRNAKARDAEQAQRAAENPGVHVGEIEARFANLPVRCVANRFLAETRYGQLFITSFADRNGNEIVYKGKRTDAVVGQTYVLTATVKKHDIFRGIRQTVVSRPIWEREDVADLFEGAQ